jgi:hypothetical protein
MSSRLFQEIREKRGLCYTIFAQAGAYADTGMTDDLCRHQRRARSPSWPEITIDEMKRAAEDMSEAEVARARAQMKAGLLMGLESPSNRAERLARLVQIWDRVPPLEETVARIDAVTTGDVRAHAEACSPPRPAALALYGPSARALAAMQGAAAPPDAAAKRKLRIETERLTLRPPLHSDFAPGRRCGAKPRFPDPVGARWAADHLSRKAFTNRVYWAQRSISNGSACRCS